MAVDVTGLKNYSMLLYRLILVDYTVLCFLLFHSFILADYVLQGTEKFHLGDSV
jgi:hypothetical protein